jgi:hypothetical protein
MVFSRAHQTTYLLPLVGVLMLGAPAMAAHQDVAELSLRGLPSHPKWLPDEPPLFGSYLSSGEGEASGAVTGHVVWDLYEDQSLEDRHPTFFRGFLEHDGHRYPFEIIGIYAPASSDKKRWHISGAIAFSDKLVLGKEQQLIAGEWEAATRTSHFTVWADSSSQ